MLPLRSLSDERLAGMVCRDDEAFVVLYERYREPLSRYIRSIVHEAEDCRDAQQNTMLAALRALRDRPLSGRVKPWLYRIAHNESINLLRRRRAHEPLDEQTPGREPGHEQFESWQALVADLRSLPDRQRSALLMRELAGLEYDEIGAAFTVTAVAARKLVFEARAALAATAAGRTAGCEEVRIKLSDRDGRALRGRRIRGHLDACAPCAAFAQSMKDRRRVLGTVPVLPASALGLLSAAGAGGIAGTGAVAGGGITGAGLAGSVTGAAIGGGATSAMAIKGLALCALCAIAGTTVVIGEHRHTGPTHRAPGAAASHTERAIAATASGHHPALRAAGAAPGGRSRPAAPSGAHPIAAHGAAAAAAAAAAATAGPGLVRLTGATSPPVGRSHQPGAGASSSAAGSAAAPTASASPSGAGSATSAGSAGAGSPGTTGSTAATATPATTSPISRLTASLLAAIVAHAQATASSGVAAAEQQAAAALSRAGASTSLVQQALLALAGTLGHAGTTTAASNGQASGTGSTGTGSSGTASTGSAATGTAASATGASGTPANSGAASGTSGSATSLLQTLLQEFHL